MNELIIILFVKSTDNFGCVKTTKLAFINMLREDCQKKVLKSGHFPKVSLALPPPSY